MDHCNGLPLTPSLIARQRAAIDAKIGIDPNRGWRLLCLEMGWGLDEGDKRAAYEECHVKRY